MDANLETWLTEVLGAVSNVCSAAEVDFFIVGAIARDLWLAEHGKSTGRITRDIDLALYIDTVAQFEAVKSQLASLPDYSVVSENPFRIVAANRYAIDLLPFNEIESTISERPIAVQVGVNVDLAGFSESYRKGTVLRELAGEKYYSLTMPALVLLKLNAIRANEERLIKDLGDIFSVLAVYGDLELEELFDKHDDLWDGSRGLEEVSLLAMGRNIRRLISLNSQLIKSINDVLKNLASLEASRIRNAGGKIASVEKLRQSLIFVYQGFNLKLE